MATPEKPELPRWVFWSTRESINSDIPSVTAIIETIIAVPLYWWVAIHFETYLPLLISAAIAPLLLLRSDESTALGRKWFEAKVDAWGRNADYDQLSSREFALLVPGIAIVLGVVSYLSASII